MKLDLHKLDQRFSGLGHWVQFRQFLMDGKIPPVPGYRLEIPIDEYKRKIDKVCKEFAVAEGDNKYKQETALPKDELTVIYVYFDVYLGRGFESFSNALREVGKKQQREEAKKYQNFLKQGHERYPGRFRIPPVRIIAPTKSYDYVIMPKLFLNLFYILTSEDPNGEGATLRPYLGKEKAYDFIKLFCSMLLGKEYTPDAIKKAIQRA